MSGTKRTGSSVWRSRSSPRTSKTHRRWSSSGPTGSTARPPSDELRKQQRLRHDNRPGGGEQAVELPRLRPAERAVADADLHLRVADGGEVEAGGLGQRRVAFDAVNLRPHLRQDGRLIPAAGADVEHAHAGFDAQQLGHAGDDVRLADGLAAVERGRAVGAGVPAARHEPLARDAAHRRQHALVLDPAGGDLVLHHPLPLLDGRVIWHRPKITRFAAARMPLRCLMPSSRS